MPPTDLLNAWIELAARAAAHGFWWVVPLTQTTVLLLLWLMFMVWVVTRLLIAGIILYTFHQLVMHCARAFVASWRPRP